MCRAGGALFIDGRGGHPGLDPSVPNWESGIALTMLGVLFYRNFANRGGALVVGDPWPFLGVVQDSEYAHNEALVCQHDYVWWNVPVRTHLCSFPSVTRLISCRRLCSVDTYD